MRFARALDRNNERIAEDEGLSASELRTMFYIAEHVSVTPKQLSEHMRLTTAAVTFITRRLVDIGMLGRVDNPDDRRSILLELTPRAHAAMARIHSEFDGMIAKATSSLDADQLDAFTSALTVVATEIFDHVGRGKAPLTADSFTR